MTYSKCKISILIKIQNQKHLIPMGKKNSKFQPYLTDIQFRIQDQLSYSHFRTSI